MSRNPRLEAVCEARYLWENAAGPERPERLREYHRLLDESLAKSALKSSSREDLEDALVEIYREFRCAKRLEERAKLSRLR